MPSVPSIGATTYNPTTLTVDDEKCAAAFDREVFTPDFDDDEDEVTSAAELETILGISVIEEETTPNEADPDREDSSSPETEPDSQPNDGSPADESSEESAETVEAETAVSPEAEQMFSEDGVDKEYSALRRFRSRFDSFSDVEDENEVSVNGGEIEERDDSDTTSQNGSDDTDGKALPAVANTQTRIESLIARVRNLF